MNFIGNRVKESSTSNSDDSIECEVLFLVGIHDWFVHIMFRMDPRGLFHEFCNNWF